MRSRFVYGLVLLMSLSFTARASDLPNLTPDPNMARTAVPSIFKWSLSPLFPNDQAWEEARSQLETKLPSLLAFKGKLNNPTVLAECLKLYFQLHNDVNHVTLYANLKQNVALGDSAATSMMQKGTALMDKLMQTASFIRQEILALPKEALAKAYASQPVLAEYKTYIDGLSRRANRVLSPDAERVLSLLGDNLWAEIDLNELPSSLEDAFNAMLADIPWPKVKDDKGQEVPFNLSLYSKLRRSTNRDVRRGAVEAALGTLRQYQDVMAAALGGQVKLNTAYARARGYDTAIEAYLDKDNLDPAVYDNLIKTINANLPLLHRYISTRKKIMGLNDIHLYDMSVPIVANVSKDIPFNKGREMILEALKPLGTEYTNVLSEGLDPAKGWIDLYPHKDKNSGAFSANVYGAHPYVMMNYQNDFNDASTLAHEFGHAMHSYFSMKNQPYSTSRYVPAMAEIASTCNEAFLSNYLIAHAVDPTEKAYLLVKRLDSIRGTIFRQTQFAEFEREIHRMAEAGTPLTAELLDKTYLNLVKKYYGPDFTTDANDGMEWAYIPHFYYKYYVWGYATGLASGMAIADRVEKLGEPAVKDYFTLLSAGNSRAPLEILKGAGVDLSKPEAIEASMRIFKETLDEVEKLLVRN